MREDLRRRGRALEYLTIGWNAAEAVAALVAGVLAGSIALVGFGIDSVIEVSSATAVLWRFRAGGAARDERTALRIVGGCFLALAAYVCVDAVRALWTREPPRESWFGIAIAAISLVAMPLLARAKRRVAAEASSAALHADSRQTDICAYLSAILLAGLGLHALLGWWWADPAAALVMAPLIAYEGVRALRGHACDDCVQVSTGISGTEARH